VGVRCLSQDIPVAPVSALSYSNQAMPIERGILNILAGPVTIAGCSRHYSSICIDRSLFTNVYMIRLLGYFVSRHLSRSGDGNALTRLIQCA
jgi:hypothetical protein